MKKSILFGLAALPAIATAQEKPNIIYIMTDQQGAAAMSCAGNPDLQTPNMDLLASRGVRFTNAYCAMPLSGPSRAAMFTGYMPSQCGMIENEMPLVDSLRANTLGSLMTDAGYDCAYAGKWHVNTISIPDGEFGFRNIKDNGDIGLAEACVDYLRERDKKEPFFLVASFINPHNICEYARGQKTPHASVLEPALEECPNLPDNFAVSPYEASVLRFEQSQNYKLYPCNYIAMDTLNGEAKFTDKYTDEDKAQFEAYLNKQIEKIDLPNKDMDFLRHYMLVMYANPAINHLKAIEA